ncbi:MAG: hypothetical protein ACK5LJ_06780, partial [Paracoccus sp. (in: a-proteobacteria)]
TASTIPDGGIQPLPGKAPWPSRKRPHERAKKPALFRDKSSLRKSRARALAEAEGTSAQIGAWTGHESLSEIERYIRNFNKRKVLSSTKTEQKVPTQPTKVPNLQ